MENDRVIISDSLEGFTDERLRHYVAHALCLGGRMEFDFNGHHFEFAHGDLMIVRKTALMSDIELSDDFRVKVIYVENGFVEQCTPQSNYGMKGQMALFMNPVMHLEEAQYELCVQDFNSVEFRYHAEGPFHEEGLRCAIQLMIVDFFDFHATLYGEPVLSPQYARILNGFFGMLDAGAYRKNREVSQYANSGSTPTPPSTSRACCATARSHSCRFRTCSTSRRPPTSAATWCTTWARRPPNSASDTIYKLAT